MKWVSKIIWNKERKVGVEVEECELEIGLYDEEGEVEECELETGLYDEEVQLCGLNQMDFGLDNCWNPFGWWENGGG